MLTKQYPLNRFLYQFVGKHWQWTDKLSYSDEQWQAYAASDDLRTWVAYCKGAIAGYFERQKHPGGNVEIAHFGLVEDFTGKGFGGLFIIKGH